MTAIAQLQTHKPETWPQWLEFNCAKYGDRACALRHKWRGVWQPQTWKDYADQVKYLALGLLSLGIEPGDKGMIVGDTAPEWCYAELAIQANHGVAVGASPHLPLAELEYLATNSDARFAIVQDQEQVDKLLQIKTQVRQVIYWNYKGLAHYDHPLLMGYRQVLERGKEYEQTHAGVYEQNVATGKADEVCAIVYTAGTTRAAPNGALHTYRTMRAGADHYLTLDPWKPTDHFVPYLPPIWITGQYLSIGCHLLSGCTLDFAESPETYRRDAREVGPTIVDLQPRQWENQRVAAQAEILGSDVLKRSVYRLCMPVGYRMADLRCAKQRPNLLQKSLYALASFVLFNPMRYRLGLSNARICYSSGGILNADASRFYHALNLPLKSLYGTTEGGTITGASADDIHPETVGPVYGSIEIRVTDEGELVYRHPGVFVGYQKDPERTSLVLRDGWFSSGDCGRVREDGHVVLVDRLADMITLASGDKLAPQFAESQLRTSPFIKDAWVLAASGGTCVAAVVVINHASVGRWAGQHRVRFATFAELSQRLEVYDLIKQEIDRINRALPSGTRIRKYVNLYKEFDEDQGELTQTHKLKRRVLRERYCDLVNALYGNQTQVSIQAPVTHRDGRTETVETSLAIHSVEGTAA